jgi:broad-specificity NMP kinase
MFNVCPGCGQYSEAKDVIPLPTVAICKFCSYGSPFLSLPLFVVTGASGSGKTTAALKMARQASNVVVLDQDILWRDEYNTPEDDYRDFRNDWLRMVKNIHQSGRSVVLFGTAIPAQFEKVPERRYIGKIHYLGLVCEATQLKKRLMERPAWRKSGIEENLADMDVFNQWLKDNAEITDPKIKLLDTTSITVLETVAAIQEWVNENLVLTGN